MKQRCVPAEKSAVMFLQKFLIHVLLYARRLQAYPSETLELPKVMMFTNFQKIKSPKLQRHAEYLNSTKNKYSLRIFGDEKKTITLSITRLTKNTAMLYKNVDRISLKYVGVFATNFWYISQKNKDLLCKIYNK